MENNNGVIRYTTKETAQCIREALKAAFSGVKFSVRTSYGSMTSSTDISWTDGPTLAEVNQITDKFTSRGFDGMTDSNTYHAQKNAAGETVHYSGWVHTTRDISADLLTKAINRYNQERARYGFGPAALEVKTSGRWSHLAGPDANKENPCGGRETWCSGAVMAFASKMRTNGALVTLKDAR